VKTEDEGVYTVFEGSDIEASFPATEEGWQFALAYRDDTLAKYTAEELAAVGVNEEEK
jgi:hypothetical protein